MRAVTTQDRSVESPSPLREAEPLAGDCTLSILVVSYNTRELTLECLGSVFEHTPDLDLEVIVVDNDSTDGSADAIEAAFPGVRLIRSPENLGFSAANNRAAERARGEFLLLLNPDTKIQDDAIPRALARLRERPDVGALGARTLYGDGSLNATSCFGPPTLWSTWCTATGLSVLFEGSPLFNPHGLGGYARDAERDVGTVTGCFLMIRTALWRQLGGFDERFFMYGEDVDLSLRIHRAGYRCILHPGATIVHYGGRSDHVRADKMVKVNRARAQVMRKHWRAPAVRAGVVLLDLAVAARVLVHAMLAPIRPASVEKREMWRDVWAKRELWRREEGDEALRATSRPLEGRARLAVRWARFALRSLREGHLDFVANALRAEARLVALWLGDLLPGGARVECNLCGWRGRRFYPNTGPGYDDLDTTCPGCRGLARHRSLVAILHAATDFFVDGKRVIEVAPMRGFEEICRKHPGLDYTSFDLERHAMETGDITAMRWADESVDYFVGFHVLEHIPDEAKALDEIRRVLRIGGGAVLQVPIDWHVESTVEYPGPNPRDVGHVRRHGRDFAQRVASRGFEVQAITASSVVGREPFSRHGLSDEPVFIARRTGEA